MDHDVLGVQPNQGSQLLRLLRVPGIDDHGSPGVEADDVVRLSTTLGRFEARVVHVVQLAPARTEGEREKPQFRLGLEWLNELKNPSAMQMPPPETA